MDRGFSTRLADRHTRALRLLALVGLAAAACGAPPDRASREGGGDGKLRVVATIGMITDAARRVGGERVDVTGLMGPGVDPHLYKASEGDVGRLAGADLILYNGLHLEAKLADILEGMRGRTMTVAVTETIDRDTLLAPPEFKGAHDPHIWFDVSLWITCVERVEDALAEIDPAGKDGYEARASAYIAELKALDAYVSTQAGRVPPERRVLVTAHDAFNYFGRRYGFEVRGLQGISTEAQAGAADVQGLAEFIAARKIPAIFVETSIPPRAIEAVQAAVESRGFRVAIGGSLYSDAPGSPGSGAETYAGMVRHNIDTIVSALATPDVAAASR